MNFSGAVATDLLKSSKIPDNKKQDYINFSDNDFLGLRDSLINYIKAVYPNDYNFFVESDLGLLFIELFAYVGSVLSLKADMLANENFISTARQRSSVRKLLEVIGVKLKGPVSAAADAKIEFNVPSPYSKLTIDPNNRVVDVISPEDSKQVSYTLYKVDNGFVQTSNKDGSIELYPEESLDSGIGGASSIFTNLVLLEGVLVKQEGFLDSNNTLKTIELDQFPIIENSTQVLIKSGNSETSGVYRLVENVFFASGSSDKVFQVNYDDNYKGVIVFGDGSNGSSPPAQAEYIVTYRVGGGTRGNNSKGAIQKVVTALNEFGSPETGNLENIDLARGGVDAEDLTLAKKYGPLNFKRQDRIVTIEDYAVFASTFKGSFGSIGKATAATRKAYCSANMIDVYVVEKSSSNQIQRASNNLKKELLEAINDKKMATDEVTIVDGLVRSLDLVVTINIDFSKKQKEEEIKAEVKDVILEYMSIDNRDFGEVLSLSELNRKIFEVPEVRFSTIDNLDSDIAAVFNEIILLNNLIINVSYLK